MKIASFDVGIKNLAYCVFEVSGNVVSIEDWKVVDLIESDKIVTQKCSETQKNGKQCTNNAVFLCNGRTYCKSHAEKSNIPKYDNSMKKTAKMQSMHPHANRNNKSGSNNVFGGLLLET